jgi:Zn-dependent M28 family amino/carboxypeptidase
VRESGVLARLAALAGRVHPAAVVVVRSGIPAAPARSRLRENLATSAVPVLQVWDDEILRAFEAAGAGVAEATVNVHVAVPQTTPVTLRNVIGVMRGSDPALRDTFLLLTAHYDHLGVSTAGEGDRIYNGANDDASGTAALMEIATALAGLGSKPKRSIVFIALFGEEMGLVGSRYYVRHPVFPLPQTLGALNLEQLGRTDVDGGNRVAQLNVTGYEFSNLTAVLRAAGGETGVEVLKDEKNSDPFYLRSDNQAFADGGIPAHTLSVGYVFPDYHAVGDDWPKIDYENLAKITRTIALALRRVSDSAEVPQWNPERPETERYRRARENAPTVLPD